MEVRDHHEKSRDMSTKVVFTAMHMGVKQKVGKRWGQGQSRC